LGVFNSRQQAEKVISKRIEMRMKQPAQKRFSHLKFNGGGETGDKGGKAGNKKQNKEEKRFSVWVGGEEVNDYYLTEEEAKNLAFEYEDDGYDDVVIADKDEYAEGGQAGKKGKLNATYIPKRNIKTLTTTYGNTIKGKDLLDGAYTTRKDIRQDPKMVRTIFEEEEFAEFNNGGQAKKRRRRANTQTGRSDTAVDKTRVAKPVGYRFTNAKASELRKDPYAKPTEAQVKKYLGKGIYKENRKRHSDRDKIAKL
jgi:hypothetical protein